jgi:hypothetical protein
VPKPLRTVVHSHMFTQAAQAVFGRSARREDIIAGIEWSLARETSFERFESVLSPDGRELLAMTTESSPALPKGLLVLFTVALDSVTLWYIGHAHPDDGN